MKKNILIKVFEYIVIVASIAALVLLIFNLKPTTNHFSLETYPTMAQAIEAIKTRGIKDYSVLQLNQLLGQTEKMMITEDEKLKVKREIIREAGFANFDWKETLADLTCFQDIVITILEVKEPMLVYRRGYPDEPTSKYGLGRWWSNQSRSIEDARNELAILANWGNPLTAEYKLKIPTGTRILEGKAAPQEFRNPTGQVIETRPGGGVQYFIDTVNNEWIEPTQP